MKPRRTAQGERGVTTAQIVVILVPVLFAFIGFAVDLGRIYAIRGELQSAVNAAALAAAAHMIGTETALDAAAAQANLTFNAASGYGNRYNLGAASIGNNDGFLTSELLTPTYYDSVSAAIGEDAAAVGGEAGAATARYVRMGIRADAPLLFFGFLSLGQERKTPVEVRAVAGASAPLCVACGIEPLAVAALDLEDTVDFGYLRNTRYTLGQVCSGTPAPTPLVGGTRRIPYLLLNRYNEEATLFSSEDSQAYRMGAQGMLPSSLEGRSCITIGAGDTVWASASPRACSAGVPPTTRAFVCGVASRFDFVVPDACTGVTEVDTIATAYQPDTDISDIEEYVAYTGNTRRVITVAIVESLSASDAMPALAFRQFLIEPHPDNVTINAADNNARFNALYLGYPVPLRQGRFDACALTAGPGKVVLHQ